MHNHPFGKEILSSMAIDNFIKPQHISYDKIEHIKEFIQNYKKKP